MSKNVRADESVLNLATSTGSSLRTTIPSWIVTKFGLKKGDTFRWHIGEKGEYLYVEVFKQPSIGDELGIKVIFQIKQICPNLNLFLHLRTLRPHLRQFEAERL